MLKHGTIHNGQSQRAIDRSAPTTSNIVRRMRDLMPEASDKPKRHHQRNDNAAAIRLLLKMRRGAGLMDGLANRISYTTRVLQPQRQDRSIVVAAKLAVDEWRPGAGYPTAAISCRSTTGKGGHRED